MIGPRCRSAHRWERTPPKRSRSPSAEAARSAARLCAPIRSRVMTEDRCPDRCGRPNKRRPPIDHESLACYTTSGSGFSEVHSFAKTSPVTVTVQKKSYHAIVSDDRDGRSRSPQLHPVLELGKERLSQVPATAIEAPPPSSRSPSFGVLSGPFFCFTTSGRSTCNVRPRKGPCAKTRTGGACWA